MPFRSSRSSRFEVKPRPHKDPSLRYMKHGPILPMEEERGILRRLLRR